MKRKIIWLIVALLMFIAGVATVRLRKSYSPPHATDSALTKNFSDHQADFNILVKMANEDSRVRIIESSFVGLDNKDGWPPSIYLHENEAWPRSEAELGFTKQQWDKYRSLFQKLNLESGMKRKHDMPDAIFFTASMDFSEMDEAEAAVTEKGYVYSPKGIYYSLTGTLDGIEINRPAIFFEKLNDNWYLYYEWSVSKPE
ncbi:MAG TPA: hypothetical protein VF735_13160 [Pyrinomonadaceae bacterium]|jgi:hypothetical protein